MERNHWIIIYLIKAGVAEWSKARGLSPLTKRFEGWNPSTRTYSEEEK